MIIAYNGLVVHLNAQAVLNNSKDLFSLKFSK